MRTKPPKVRSISGLAQPSNTLQDLLDGAAIAMFAVDQQYRYTAFNLAHRRLMQSAYGATIEAGASILEAITVDEDRDKTRRNLDRALNGEEFTASANPGARSPSAALHSVRYAPTTDGGGKIIGASVYSEDVSKLRRAEEALYVSESLYRISFLFGSVGIALVSPSGRFLRVNPVLCDMMGYRETEIIGMTVNEVTFEQDRPAGLSFAEDAYAGQTQTTHFERRYVRKDGTMFWADVSSTAFRDAAGALQYLVTHVQDITERKRIETLVRDSEQRLRLIFDTAIDGILFTLPDGPILSANAAACQMVGWTEEELRGMARDRVADLSDPRWRAAWEAGNGNRSFRGELTFIRKDGTRFPAEVASTQFTDQEGVSRTSVFLRDVTELKRAKEELERFFNLVPDMVCIASTDGYFKQVNSQWERDLGYSRDELLAKPLADFIHPDDREATFREVERQVRGEATSCFLNRYLAKSGGYRWLEWYATPSPDGTSLYAAAHDVTERKRVEEQMAYQAELLSEVNDAVIGTDAGLRLTYWNKAAERVFGWTEEEALGRETQELLRTRLHGSTLPTTSQPGDEMICTRKDGLEIRVHARSTALKNARGEFKGLATVARALSERK